MAEAARYVVIEGGVVVNVILWDGETPWAPAPGQTVQQSDTLQIGDAA
jgi:hypothetical protein